MVPADGHVANAPDTDAGARADAFGVVAVDLQALAAGHGQAAVDADGVVAVGDRAILIVRTDRDLLVVDHGDHRVVLDRDGVVERRVEEHLFGAGRVFEPHLVRARPAAGGRGLDRATRRTRRQLVGRHLLAVVQVPLHERPIELPHLVIDGDLEVDTRSDHTAAERELADAQPARALVVGDPLAIPREPELDLAELVAVQLLPRGTGHEAELLAGDGRRGRALGAERDTGGGRDEDVVVGDPAARVRRGLLARGRDAARLPLALLAGDDVALVNPPAVDDLPESPAPRSRPRADATQP